MQIRGKQAALALMCAVALAGCGKDAAQDNLPPIISGTPVTSLTVGTPYYFAPQAADPNGDAISFSATNLPTWAKIDVQTGVVSGTPTEADVGVSQMITIEVSDSASSTQLPAFHIAVSSTTPSQPVEVNQAPTIVGTPATTATVAQAYSFSPVGDDPDGDTLTYTITNKPAWMTFTAATGRLTGTPISTNVGTFSNITITVSDGALTASLPAFSVTVSAAAPPPNRAPTITGTPATTVLAGSAYSFRPVASDPDGNTLTFSIQNQPSWATFSATTGQLTGTPTTANVGTTARITITVSDASLSASLASFTIQVTAPANRAPTITGTPTTSVNVGTAYSFQPVGADADGDTLTYSITNKPAWATFSTTNGKLSGTPAAADAGTTTGIVISVSDSKASTSLAAFSIAVQQISTGSATIQWTAPTNNTDGSALTNLSGYRITYGTSATTLNQTATVSNASVTSYTVSNLTTGTTWYFAVSAMSASGGVSAASNVASKVIP